MCSAPDDATRTAFLKDRPNLETADEESAMEHQRFEGERTLMRIHIGESDKWHGKLLYQAIIEFLRHEGF